VSRRGARTLDSCGSKNGGSCIRVPAQGFAEELRQTKEVGVPALDDDQVHRVRIEQAQVPGKPLGRHIKHDEQSKKYPYPLPPDFDRKNLKKVEWKRAGPPYIFNQESDTMCCSGNALAGLLNTEPFSETMEKIIEERHAIAFYTHATEIDDLVGTYPLVDSGSYSLDVCKIAKKLGFISGYQHAFNMDQALAALQVGPVLTGTYWYDSFYEPDENFEIQIKGEKPIGGHVFLVRGYDPETNLVKADNSWGYDWGDRGSFYMTVETWQTLLDQEGDVTIPIAMKKSDFAAFRESFR
jgi:hypothetical protein